MPNLLYKTVAPTETCLTSGPMAAMSPVVKKNERKGVSQTFRVRANGWRKGGVRAERRTTRATQTLRPVVRARARPSCGNERARPWRRPPPAMRYVPLVGFLCAVSVSTMPPFVTVSAAATFTKTPAPQGVTFVYCEGTSNVAPARVVVVVAAPRRPRLVVGVVTRVVVTLARIVIVIIASIRRLDVSTEPIHPSIRASNRSRRSRFRRSCLMLLLPRWHIITVVYCDFSSIIP